jgi:hypothetical protein
VLPVTGSNRCGCYPVFEKMSIDSRREMLAMFNASQDGR